MENYRSEDHLYRKKASSGPDFLPSASLSKSSFDKKFLRWFEKNKDRDDDILKIYKAIQSQSELIKSKVDQKYSNLHAKDKKNKVLLTLSILDNNKRFYLSNMNNGKYQLLLQEDVRRWRREHESLGHSEGEGECYLCGKFTELAGFAVSAAGFKFSTPDKRGFLYGLSAGEFWKSIPVCDDCAENLEKAHSYIKRHLEFPRKEDEKGLRLEKTSFWVIPNTFGYMSDDMFQKFDTYVRRNTAQKKTGLIAVEDRLAGYADEIHQEPFTLTLLFFEGKQEHIDIRAIVNDVIPSRLKKLDNIQEDIRNHPLFDETHMKILFGNWWEQSFFNATIKVNSSPVVKGASEGNWPVLLLQDYYIKRIRKGNQFDYIINDRFYEIMDAVLLGKRLSVDVLSDFMIKIRERESDLLKKKIQFYEFKIEVLRSLALYMYLKESRAIVGEEKMSEENMGCDIPVEMEELFKNLGIENVEERAAVAMGILVNKTLYVQRKGRGIKKTGEEPFWNKLNGLDMDQRKFRVLLKDSIAKMRQYQESFPGIERAAAYYLQKAEKINKMSKEDVSYFFTIGLVMGDIVKLPPGNYKYNADGDNE